MNGITKIALSFLIGVFATLLAGWIMQQRLPYPWLKDKGVILLRLDKIEDGIDKLKIRQDRHTEKHEKLEGEGRLENSQQKNARIEAELAKFKIEILYELKEELKKKR